MEASQHQDHTKIRYCFESGKSTKRQPANVQLTFGGGNWEQEWTKNPSKIKLQQHAFTGPPPEAPQHHDRSSVGYVEDKMHRKNMLPINLGLDRRATLSTLKRQANSSIVPACNERNPSRNRSEFPHELNCLVVLVVLGVFFLSSQQSWLCHFFHYY